MEAVCALTSSQMETFSIQGAESDSDDEPIMPVRRKSNVGQLKFQVDSDEEGDCSKVSTLPAVDPTDTSSMEAEKEGNSVGKSLPKSKARKRRIVNFDGSSDEDADAVKPLKSYGFRNKGENHVEEADTPSNQASAEDVSSKENVNRTAEGSPEEKDGASFRNKIRANSDLFDAEGSSGDEIEPKNTDDGVSLDDIKKAARRSSKSSGKPPKAAKRPKPKKADVQQLHSDCQRMVRQSRVSLPYHVPQQRTLDDFLNRRKNVPNVIRPTAKETECILKKLVKVNQKPVAASQRTNPEPSSHLTSPKSSAILENPESGVNAAKRRLELEPCDFKNTLPDTLQRKPDEASKVECCDANLNLQPSMLDRSDEEDDLPDLMVTTSCKPKNLEPCCRLPTNPKPSFNQSSASDSVGLTNPESGDKLTEHQSEFAPRDFQNTLPRTLSKASNAVCGEADGDFQPRLYWDSDNEDDLPDLVDSALSPLRTRKQSSYSVPQIPASPTSNLQEAKLIASTLLPVQTLESLSSPPVPGCVERMTEAVSLEAGPDLTKFKIPLEDIPALKFKPRLSGAPDMVIDLDEDKFEEAQPQTSTTFSKEVTGRQKVVLSILKKEKDSSGQERLVNEDLIVTLSDETKPNSQTPGNTMLCLKEKLKAEIAKRRSEARKKRQLLRAEEEEEGFEGDHESEEEELLSDVTDSEEGDDDDECEIIGKEIKNEKKPKNKFIDDEAEEQDDDGSEEDEVEDLAEGKTKNQGVRLRLQLDSDSSDDEPPLPVNESSINLNASLSRCNTTELFPSTIPDLRSEDPEESEPQPPLAADTSMETSFELMGSLIPAHQPGGGLRRNRQQSISPLKRQCSTWSLPVESSQDLFSQPLPAEDPHYTLTPFDDCAATMWTRKSPEVKLGFLDEEDKSTQENTNELYELCSGKWADSAKSKSTGIKALCGPVSSQTTQESLDELTDLCSGKFETPCIEESNGIAALCDPLTPKDTQIAMSELAGLCSGKFSDSPESTFLGTKSLCDPVSSKTTQESLDELMEQRVERTIGIAALCDNHTPKDTQGAMAELEDLCSGKFSGPSEIGLSLPRACHAESSGETQDFTRSSKAFNPSDDELSISSLTSTGPRRRRAKRILSDDDSNEEDFSDLSDEEVNEEEVVIKENKRLKEFFEDEAELSGSDVPSDEDDEIAEEDDILEEELGDLEEELSQDELKNQVEKVHMKMMMDDDQRQLRLYKEMYLEDGDLHTEGQGRVRKFRWRNVDDDSNDDGGAKRDSESDGDDVENDAENAAFRMQRHEREKWLSEHKKSHTDDHDALLGDVEASQFKALKKVNILRRSNSLVMKPSNSPNPALMSSKQSPSFCGSFLARGKDALAKIAELTKGSGKDGLNGPRNSRNFVFAAVSPTKETQVDMPKLKRASSTPSSVKLPMTKKPRLEVSTPVTNNDSSIFDLL